MGFMLGAGTLASGPLFDAFGIDREDHSENALVLKPGEKMLDAGFPLGDDEGVTVTYQPALIRIDGDGKLIFKMDEISDFLGREMTAEIFEVNTSTHYGRMVRVDDNTVILFGNMDEVMEFI